MIIVLDTSLWVSAICFGGTPRQVIEHASGAHTIAISDRIVHEIMRALMRKFTYSSEEARGLIADFSSGAILVSITGTLHGVCRDPNDDHVLECAQLAKAGLIVTGDKDLLALDPFERIRILTSRQYMDSF